MAAEGGVMAFVVAFMACTLVQSVLARSLGHLVILCHSSTGAIDHVWHHDSGVWRSPVWRTTNVNICSNGYYGVGFWRLGGRQWTWVGNLVYSWPSSHLASCRGYRFRAVTCFHQTGAAGCIHYNIASCCLRICPAPSRHRRRRIISRSAWLNGTRCLDVRPLILSTDWMVWRWHALLFN